MITLRVLLSRVLDNCRLQITLHQVPFPFSPFVRLSVLETFLRSLTISEEARMYFGNEAKNVSGWKERCGRL